MHQHLGVAGLGISPVVSGSMDPLHDPALNSTQGIIAHCCCRGNLGLTVYTGQPAARMRSLSGPHAMVLGILSNPA